MIFSKFKVLRFSTFIVVLINESRIVTLESSIIFKSSSNTILEKVTVELLILNKPALSCLPFLNTVALPAPVLPTKVILFKLLSKSSSNVYSSPVNISIPSGVKCFKASVTLLLAVFPVKPLPVPFVLMYKHLLYHSPSTHKICLGRSPNVKLSNKIVTVFLFGKWMSQPPSSSGAGASVAPCLLSCTFTLVNVMPFPSVTYIQLAEWFPNASFSVNSVLVILLELPFKYNAPPWPVVLVILFSLNNTLFMSVFPLL